MLDDRSIARLAGVHPDLVRVVQRAAILSPLSFIVTEGLRTRERQQRLLEKGATKTLNSRHITGHAIDVAAKVDDEVRWDWPLYDELALAFKTAASELGVEIVWGGDWKTFKDGPHFELSRKAYP